MARLHLVTKQSAATTPLKLDDAPSPARIIPQLAAIDRAVARMEHACKHLTTLTDQANRLHLKLQTGTENFIAAWNVAHPEGNIRRCLGAAVNPACTRYTIDPQRLCQACRQR